MVTWEDKYDWMIKFSLELYSGLVHLLMRNKYEFDDILQECRLAVLSKLSRMTYPKCQISTVIVNTCRFAMLEMMDKARRTVKTYNIGVNLDDFYDNKDYNYIEEQAVYHEDGYDVVELETVLMKVLSKTERRRQVWELVQQGYTFNKACRMVGLSESAIRYIKEKIKNEIKHI